MDMHSRILTNIGGILTFINVSSRRQKCLEILWGDTSEGSRRLAEEWKHYHSVTRGIEREDKTAYEKFAATLALGCNAKPKRTRVNAMRRHPAVFEKAFFRGEPLPTVGHDHGRHR